MTATASWSLPRLLSALARSGWDELAGRRGGALRGLLRGLSDLLPHGSATGLVTAEQLAAAAGISERWARDRLKVLESAGIITWTRGGIVDGRPTPSLIRVSKRALAELVNHARPIRDAELARRAEATAIRLRDTLRRSTLVRRSAPTSTRTRSCSAPSAAPWWVRSSTAAPHAELGATLPPYGEETPTGDGSPVRSLINQPRPSGGSRVRELRRRIASTRSTT